MTQAWSSPEASGRVGSLTAGTEMTKAVNLFLPPGSPAAGDVVRSCEVVWAVLHLRL